MQKLTTALKITDIFKSLLKDNSKVIIRELFQNKFHLKSLRKWKGIGFLDFHSIFTMGEENFVIVDVDCGSDDAWALLMLTKADKFQKCKILAITCVAGNTDCDTVVENTLRILDSVDRTDIPVYKGCTKAIMPKTSDKWNELFYGKNGFGDVNFESRITTASVQSQHAVNAMYELVTKYPKKISFLLLGPLTNFAMCIALYDDFLDKIRDICIMGGNISAKGNVTKSAEYNLFADPEAAEIVFSSVTRPITVLPWETCIDGEYGLTMDWRFNYLGSVDTKSMKLMNRIEKAIFIPKGYTNWMACDSIAAAVFLFPKIIDKSTLYHASIELNGSHTRGQMVLDHLKTKEPNVCVVEKVNKESYKQIISWTANYPGIDIF